MGMIFSAQSRDFAQRLLLPINNINDLQFGMDIAVYRARGRGWQHEQRP